VDLFCTGQNGGFPRHGGILADSAKRFYLLGMMHGICERGKNPGGEAAIVKKLKRFQVERECK